MLEGESVVCKGVKWVVQTSLIAVMEVAYLETESCVWRANFLWGSVLVFLDICSGETVWQLIMILEVFQKLFLWNWNFGHGNIFFLCCLCTSRCMPFFPQSIFFIRKEKHRNKRNETLLRMINAQNAFLHHCEPSCCSLPPFTLSPVFDCFFFHLFCVLRRWCTVFLYVKLIHKKAMNKCCGSKVSLVISFASRCEPNRHYVANTTWRDNRRGRAEASKRREIVYRWKHRCRRHSLSTGAQII